MSFVAQILLSDVPLPSMPANALLSFHYCETCTEQGNMPWGWTDKENNCYDLTIFSNVDQEEADCLGMVAAALIEPYHVSFRDIEEVPGDDHDASMERIDLPKDYPQGKDDFDENVYPGLKHVRTTKVGGWPTWAQYPEWPVTENGNKYTFLAQLDWKTFDRCAWAGGGYAYLFLYKISSDPRAELLIQVT